MVWWRRVDDETDAGGGPFGVSPPVVREESEAEKAHRLSGNFSGDSYWGGSPASTSDTAAKSTDSAPEPESETAGDDPGHETSGHEASDGAADAEVSAPDADAEPHEPDAAADMPTAPDPLPQAQPTDSVESDNPNLPIPESTPERHDAPMADYQSSLNEAMQIDGALGVALVDSQSGMALATAGNPDGLDLNVAAAGNSNVVQAKMRTMRDLGLNQKLEDILITLETQYHIIRTFNREDGIFLYLVLDKARANLAMARFKLAGIEKQLVI